MALQVIGAGFGRTGTLSLKAALEQLGFSKCHHMEEVVRSARQIDLWDRLARGEEVDWDRVFEGFLASCDWPSCNYWEELLDRYPDAKVILTVRDPERWYQSAAETIYRASVLARRTLGRIIPRLGRTYRMIFAIVWDGTFEGRFEDRDYAIRVYLEHNERVKQRVPPERLLVFEAKDGWEPLCAFLGVPVPEGPYPHLNDSSQIKRMIRIVKIVIWGGALALIAGLGLLLL